MPLLSENSNDRVMLFMDLQNILRSVEAIGTLKLGLDFYSLAAQLAGTRQLVGMYAFDTRRPLGTEDRFTYDEMAVTCQTFVTSQDPIIDDISSIISTMAQERGLTREGTINLVLSFVQSLDYAFDEGTAGQDEYWRYPVETLYEGAGDCEDMSFLFASVIEAMGYDVIILLFEDHMAVGVACAGASGTYYNLDGSRYFYCEMTASGWELGRAPRECGSAQVIQVE